MLQKLRKILVEASDIMEIFMAFVVVAGIVVATVTLYPHMMEFWEHRMEPEAFLEFLEMVLNVVIGIELVKMLCKPNSANIIEVLIFLISRHMIIERTTAIDDFLSVLSIGVLFLFRRFMLATKPDKNNRIPHIFWNAARDAGKAGSESEVESGSESEAGSGNETDNGSKC